MHRKKRNNEIWNDKINAARDTVPHDTKAIIALIQINIVDKNDVL